MNYTKQFAFQVKEAAPNGEFSGLAASFGTLDSDGEIIDRGAFAKCLKDITTVPILWQHQRQDPCGWATELREDSQGLRVKGRLMIDAEIGRRAQSFLKLGLEVGGRPGLSIGFVVPQDGDYFDKGVRHFKEIMLREFSLVTFPANSLAMATSAKAAGDAIDPEKLGGMLDDVHMHLQNAKSAHAADHPRLVSAHLEKGIASLNVVRDFVSSWYANYDVNLPNPVGNANRAAEAALLIRETEDFLRLMKG